MRTLRMPQAVLLPLIAAATFTVALAAIPIAPPSSASAGAGDLQKDGPITERVAELVEEIEENNDTASGQRERETAIRALGRVNHHEAVVALLPLLADDHGHIRELTEIVIVGAGPDRYYPGIRDAAAVEALVEQGLTDRTLDIRIGTARCLARMAQRETTAETVAALGPRILEIALEDRDDAAKGAMFDVAALTGVTIGDRQMRDVTRGLRGDAAPATLRLLSRLGYDDEIDWDRLWTNDAPNQVAIVDELARRRDSRLAEYVGRAMDRRGTVEGKIAAVEALPVLKVMDADAMLTAWSAALGDESWRVRVTAVHAALDIWMKELIGPLVTRFAEEEGRLRLDLWIVLKVLTDEALPPNPELWGRWWRANEERYSLDHPQPERGEWGWNFTELEATAGSDDTAAYFNIPLLSNSLLFCFDPSGSMGNPDDAIPNGLRRIDFAARQAAESLGSLGEDAMFNILLWEYSSDLPPSPEPRQAFRRMTPNTPAATQQATEFVQAYEPGGWGDFYGALLHAFASEEIDTVIFLSDGGATRGRYTRTEEFMPALREANRFRRVAVHTVLIGDDEESFMNAIATTTGGLYASAIAE